MAIVLDWSKYVRGILIQLVLRTIAQGFLSRPPPTEKLIKEHDILYSANIVIGYAALAWLAIFLPTRSRIAHAIS